MNDDKHPNRSLRVIDDKRYSHALTGALVILDEIDKNPDMPKHNRLALVLFTILHTLESWDETKGEIHARFSAN